MSSTELLSHVVNTVIPFWTTSLKATCVFFAEGNPLMTCMKVELLMRYICELEYFCSHFSEYI